MRRHDVPAGPHPPVLLEVDTPRSTAHSESGVGKVKRQLLAGPVSRGHTRSVRTEGDRWKGAVWDCSKIGRLFGPFDHVTSQ